MVTDGLTLKKLRPYLLTVQRAYESFPAIKNRIAATFGEDFDLRRSTSTLFPDVDLTVLAVVLTLDTDFLVVEESVTMSNAACFFEKGKPNHGASSGLERHV
ncbi:hypothetical protein LTS08_008775 [Lithohypha guttulata]|nr:hypothetical protein LTS08_008775 [Lithohypha guttulata]